MVRMANTAITPEFIRRRDAATLLAVSQSQLAKWERQGVLRAIHVPGIRATRYRFTDVTSLARNIERGVLSSAETV